MQNPIRRFVVPVAALLALSVTLAACDASSSSDNTPQPPSVATVHPAAGTPLGVVAKGKSATDDVSSGLSYTCSPKLRAAKVPFDTTVNYSGTNIDYSDDSQSVKVSKTETYIDQTEVTLALSGSTVSDFKSKAVSLIVIPQENGPYRPVDQRVINLGTTAWNGKNAIKLDTTDYSYGGWITDVMFCMNP